ncbi:hypothetical protein [Caulobacter sp. NIBR1757]|uniref:hypothetical protein n=1 Tax=Caulobacter sp. NIBR1757 TaxID=3016000 RepID=UPI0022F03D66|nr:hypothetical protein [Caulobacter sp. NIBR1757]WGM38074.1 hypothetical protein AMEJIAPC_00975 [Caulobacter sp. NIBR1757]
MKRKIVAHKVADQLFVAELAIDRALSETARLTSMLSDARVEAGLSAVVGQSVMDRTCASIVMLANGRRELVEAHGHLSDVKNQIGLRAVAIGGMDKPEENAPPPSGELDQQPAERRASRLRRVV